MTERYPRSTRLTQTGEFSSVFGYRCVIRSPNFSLFAKPSTSIAGRLGLAIARRIAARAVDRNYMKRVIREIFRRHNTDFIGLDVVVQPRKVFGRGTYTVIERELLVALKELRKKCLASS